jgi:hypothetical protein
MRRRAGDDMLSRMVNAAIGNSVLYEGLMKPMARRTLINTVRLLLLLPSARDGPLMWTRYGSRAWPHACVGGALTGGEERRGVAQHCS